MFSFANYLPEDKSSKSNDVFNTDGDHGYPEIKKVSSSY